MNKLFLKGGELANMMYVVAGSFFIALGVVFFLALNQVATGGTPGLAILLAHIFPGISLGVLMILINIPLLLLGMKYLGKSFGVRTVITIILVSAFTDFLNTVLRVQPVSDELLLAAVFGGIAVGLGAGLVMRGNSSAGGSTIVARILAANFSIKPGRTILAIDAFIICSSAFVFNGIEPSLWSLICIYVTSRCIDVVLTGGPSEKVVHIVTQHIGVISEKIHGELGPRGTVVSGNGLVDGEEKTMIFVTIENSRLATIREIVMSNDPEAFIVVMNAADLRGRGH